MIKQILKPRFLLGTFLLVFISCTKDIDFNQVNDFEISPVVEFSLVFLDEPASRFLDNGIEVTTVQDSIDITFFENEFLENNLIKADFVFETANSINRDFQVQIEFFDEFNQLVHVFWFEVSASIANTSVIENYTETFEDNTLISLKATRKMAFTLSALPGIPITEDTVGIIQLKSKGVFYLNIDNQFL